MVINTKGVEINDTQYIKKDGIFLLKIEEFVEDGYSNEGNPKFKLLFKGMEIIDNKMQSTTYAHTEFYSTDAKMLWKIKQLELGLKAPEIYDINNFIGRYAIAIVKMEEYNGKTNARVKEWQYSPQNDKMPPIPEATQEQSSSDVQSEPEIDISEDEIPF